MDEAHYSARMSSGCKKNVATNAGTRMMRRAVFLQKGAIREGLGKCCLCKHEGLGVNFSQNEGQLCRDLHKTVNRNRFDSRAAL